MKPLIGISADRTYVDGRARNGIGDDYTRAVQLAGGIPVLLPFIETDAEAAEVLDRIDGILLSGGPDADPQLFGEMPHPKNGAIEPVRDTAEMAYIREAMRRNLPTLGICRGHQVLAIANGARLWQDLPSQVPAALKHAQQAPRWHASHPVTVKADTRLAQILGAGEMKVNSFHHQAVKDVPAGWVVGAEAPDGVNEALEHPGFKFMLSVQWHPENFAGRAYNFDRLFQALVAASTK